MRVSPPKKMRKGWSSTPRAGTKKNALFRDLLRPQGLSSVEAREKYGTRYASNIDSLRDFCGFDIRSFRDPNHQHVRADGRPCKHPVIYKIVGRQKWDGGYVSFVNPEDY